MALHHVRTRPGLKRYLLMPFFCSFLFLLGAGLCWQSVLAWILLQLPVGSVGEWLGLLLQSFSWLAFGIFSALCFSMLGMVLASPFNDLLCRKVLAQRGANLPQVPFFQGAWRSLRDATLWMLLKCILYMLSLLLPGLSLLCFFLFIGIDHFDVPWSTSATGLSQKFRRLFETKGEFLGFMLVYGLLYMIPFVGVFIMPLAVVSASLLVKLPCDKEG